MGRRLLTEACIFEWPLYNVSRDMLTMSQCTQRQPCLLVTSPNLARTPRIRQKALRVLKSIPLKAKLHKIPDLVVISPSPSPRVALNSIYERSMRSSSSLSTELGISLFCSEFIFMTNTTRCTFTPLERQKHRRLAWTCHI